MIFLGCGLSLEYRPYSADGNIIVYLRAECPTDDLRVI